MSITERVIAILLALRQYKFLTTALIRDWCVPNDKDASITREVLRKMLAAGFVRRFRAEVNDPLVTPSTPVWTPTEAGCCVLATKTGDASLLLDALPYSNNWMQFAHYVAVAKLMHTIAKAFEAQTYAKMGTVYFEHDVKSDAKEPEKKFRLYTLVSTHDSKRVVCAPDAAAEFFVEHYRRVIFFELERGTDSPRRTSAKKMPGYSGMDRHFQTLFPEAQDWRVLFVWPNAGLRDAARRSVDPAKAATWLFAALPDITESFLHAPVIYTAGGDGPKPFIKAPTPVPTPLPDNQAE